MRDLSPRTGAEIPSAALLSEHGSRPSESPGPGRTDRSGRRGSAGGPSRSRGGGASALEESKAKSPRAWRLSHRPCLPGVNLAAPSQPIAVRHQCGGHEVASDGINFRQVAVARRSLDARGFAEHSGHQLRTPGTSPEETPTLPRFANPNGSQPEARKRNR